MWERLAFAILSANTLVSAAVEALRRARQHRFSLPPSAREGLSITPDRCAFVNALPHGPGITQYERVIAEPWHE